MKRPWQIWLVFVLCLAFAIPALVWLSRVALQLDYEQRLARSRAELDEVAANVLWQTDAALTRVIAPETARPYSMYQPVWRIPDEQSGSTITPSPLLLHPSPYVRIHFQIDPDGRWSSPQCPEGLAERELLQWGINPDQLSRAREHLYQLQRTATAQHLLAHLTSPALAQMAQLRGSVDPGMSNQVVSNRYVEDWLRENTSEPIDAQSIPLGKGEYAEHVQQTAQALRRGKNLKQRSEYFQQQAQQESTHQNFTYNLLNSVVPSAVAEGPTEIFWHDEFLLAARRTIIEGKTYVQGCWFDWPKLHQQIIKDAVGVLPNARIEPVRQSSEAAPLRLLAVLPARLVVPEPTVAPLQFSAVHWALLIAWSLLALTALSTASLLYGVVALSERRAAFVSAVTHELRTPLTTFRLYSEMLAEGMVSEERRATYLETLQREAERLSHLVENVLQYARLERGAGRRRLEAVEIGSLVDRISPTLARRAEQVEMEVIVEMSEAIAEQKINTDAGVVEQILFNLVDNACKYAGGAADRRIHCGLTVERNHVQWTIRDHGPGISTREAKRLFRPFHKSAEQAAESAPGVGLGLALCRRLAKQIGGRLLWQPANGGATFCLLLPLAEEATQA